MSPPCTMPATTQRRGPALITAPVVSSSASVQVAGFTFSPLLPHYACGAASERMRWPACSAAAALAARRRCRHAALPPDVPRAPSCRQRILPGVLGGPGDKWWTWGPGVSRGSPATPVRRPLAALADRAQQAGPTSPQIQALLLAYSSPALALSPCTQASSLPPRRSADPTSLELTRSSSRAAGHLKISGSVPDAPHAHTAPPPPRRRRRRSGIGAGPPAPGGAPLQACPSMGAQPSKEETRLQELHEQLEEAIH